MFGSQYNIYYIYYGIVHEVQRKLITLSMPIKSDEKPSEPFRTYNKLQQDSTLLSSVQLNV